MSAVETNALIKIFGSHTAVNSLDLHIPSGAVCGFLGRNGAGKTTTLKMLAGLSCPSSGRIKLQGQERHYGKCDNSNIGYLPDVPNFYPYFTAREYLNFCGRLFGMDKKNRLSRTCELLERTGLKDNKTPISGYSRGMKQRLGIAGTLMNSPGIIFLDEPVSALDPAGRCEVMALIQALRGSVTVLFSTHILSDVEKTCDYAVILDHGKLILSDTIDNIKSAYTGNSALLRLNTVSGCEGFLNAVSSHNSHSKKKIEIKRTGQRELKLYADRLETISCLLPKLLYQSHADIEHYEGFSPSLEDIFMEVTSYE